jgi:hypothetical protein
VAAATPPNDVSLREHGAQLRRGVILEELFVYWSDERGNDVAPHAGIFPTACRLVRTRPTRRGAGLPATRQVARGVCLFGDGATSTAGARSLQRCRCCCARHHDMALARSSGEADCRPMTTTNRLSAPDILCNRPRSK